MGENRVEMLAAGPPAPACAVGSAVSKTAADDTNARRTEARVQLTSAEQSACAQKPLGLLSYRCFLVILWFALKDCEYNDFSITPCSASSVLKVFSSGGGPFTCWTPYSLACRIVEGTSRRYGSQLEIQPLSSVVSTRWKQTSAADVATARSVGAAASEIRAEAGRPVLSTVIRLAGVSLFCGGPLLKALYVVACMPVALLLTHSPLFGAYGADLLVPAGRTAIGRSKNGAANGPAAPLGAAGTERTAAAATAAGPAVNEAAGNAGRREKRGGGAGEGAKSGAHNDVVVARGAGDATAVVAAAAGTSVSTQEEGFARDSYWARSLRRRWGEQAYLDMVARTINGLESDHFWLAMLGKQLHLQSSKMHLKTQRIERHKLEQRRKKQAMAAFNQALGKAETAAAELRRHQRRGGGGAAGAGGVGMSDFLRVGGVAGVPDPRPYTGGGGGAKNEAELRFEELSLYTLDWVGPRTCAQLGWATGNDVCALSLEIEIHVLHSRLLLKSVEVQDRQNRLFVCDTGAAFFRASAAALAKQEGPERPLYNTSAGVRNAKNCPGCDIKGADSTLGSTTTTTVRGRDRSRDAKGGAPRSPHTATTGVASVGAMPEAPLAFWDDQGGYGDEWTHGGGSRVGATGIAGGGGSKERRTTGIGADKRRANRAPAGGGAGAAGPHTASSSSPGRVRATAGEKAGRKGQQQQHHGGGAEGEEKHQHLSRGGEEGSAAGGERRTGGTTKKRKRSIRRKKRINSHNKNVAASLGTLHETFDWEAIAQTFYIPALADLQPPSKSMVQSLTTELAYLMGVLDREESLRSGRPAVIATSLLHNRYRSPFTYSSMPPTVQQLGLDRAGVEKLPAAGIIPRAGGGQIRRPSPLDRKRTAAGSALWAADNWAGNKPLASVQGTLATAPAAGPVGTSYHDSIAENRVQAPNVQPMNSVAGPIPQLSVRRPRGLHAGINQEKEREPIEQPTDKRRFPLVHVASSSRMPHNFPEPRQKEQPQPYPWRPAIPPSTPTQYANPKPDPGKPRLATMVHTQQGPALQKGQIAEWEGRIPATYGYGGVREKGRGAPIPLPIDVGGSTPPRNQKWWTQLTAGAGAEKGSRQLVSEAEPDAEN